MTLADVLAAPAQRRGYAQCGFKLLRARLTPGDAVALDAAVDLVRSEREAYTLGTAPHSGAWLRRSLAEIGEHISRLVIDRHIGGTCSC